MKTINDIVKYDELFKKYAAEYGLEWKWLKAIAWKESTLGLNPKVQKGETGTDGLSYGLMQVTIRNAESFGVITKEDMNNPEIQIDMAAKLLSKHKEKLEKSGTYTLEALIRSYNAGFVKSLVKGASGKINRPIFKARINTASTHYWNVFKENLASIK